jgi:hypothetical protein
VGAAEATVVGAGTVYNNGTLLGGGVSGGGADLVTIGGNAALEVDGGSMIGGAAGAGSGSIVVGQAAADTALFAMTGALTIGATGAVALGGAQRRATETFLDTGNRGAFAGGLVQLDPSFAGDSPSWRWNALGYAPLCVSDPPLERVMHRLRQRSPKLAQARPAAALA